MRGPAPFLVDSMHVKGYLDLHLVEIRIVQVQECALSAVLHTPTVVNTNGLDSLAGSCSVLTVFNG